MRALCLLALLTVACTPDQPLSPRPSPPEPTPEETPAPPEEPPVEEPPPEPELPEAREVRIPAGDGLELVGDLRAGDTPTAPLAILVHQLSTNRHEWEPLLRRLGVEPAMTTFAVDMRGHGDSTRRRNRDVTWNDLGRRDWDQLADDVLRVVSHLRETEGLAPTRVFFVGSSIGSSAVIVAASRDQSVNAVVALSPGRAYRGVDALTPLGQLGERPLLAVASAEEPDSATTAHDMARIAGHGTALIVDGDRHGVAMFESAPTSLDRVVEFLREQAAL